eukprot:4741899-Amphidinium_carterae.1
MAARQSPVAAIVADLVVPGIKLGRRACQDGRYFFLSGGTTSPSPRVRGRQNRAQLARALAVTLLASLLWLKQGGVLRSGDGLPGLHASHSCWDLCVRWGRAASRTDPGESWDFGRGRLREILERLLEKKSSSVATCFNSFKDVDLAYGLYQDSAGASTSVPFNASRLALPPKAACIPLEEHVSAALLSRFCAPDPSGVDVSQAAPRYFNADRHQWYHLLRRMARIGLLTLLDADAAQPHLTSGAFAVKKDRDHDRLIADRRPMNSMETMIAKPQLPYVAALCSCYLPPGKVWRLSSRDLKDYYFQLAVPPARWPKQQVGPRVPRAWFLDLENDSLDSVGAPSAWHWPDLHATCDSASTPSPLADWCQPCITAVMMGDVNGVTIAQEAHAHSLSTAGLLPEHLRLMKGEMQWNRAEVVDVYIDDVGCLAAVDSGSRHGDAWDSQHMRKVDAHYVSTGVCQSSHKAVDADLHGKIWGAEIDGLRGLVGAPEQHLYFDVLVFSAWDGFGCAVCTPTERSVAESIVGTMSCSFLFQRGLFSILGRTYPFLRTMKKRKKTPLPSEVADEIFVASCMQLAADTCVRWPLLHRVCASDASLRAGGVAWLDVPAGVAERLYDFVEHSGDRPLLSEVLESPDTCCLKDCREDAGRLLGRAPWQVGFYFTFKCHEHINVLELRALVRLVHRLSDKLPSEVVDWSTVLAELDTTTRHHKLDGFAPTHVAMGVSATSPSISCSMTPCGLLDVCGAAVRLVKACCRLGVSAISWNRALDARGQWELSQWVRSGRVQVVWIRLGLHQRELLDWCIDLVLQAVAVHSLVVLEVQPWMRSYPRLRALGLLVDLHWVCGTDKQSGNGKSSSFQWLTSLSSLSRFARAGSVGTASNSTAAHSNRLCVKLAHLVHRELFWLKRKGWCKWERLVYLLLAGDIETNPGPRASRNVDFPLDLIDQDVSDRTKKIYEERLESLRAHWHSPECSTLLQVFASEQVAAVRIAQFIRHQCATNAWGKSHAAQLLAAAKRYMLWGQASGYAMPSPEHVLAPSRRLLRAWKRYEPVVPHTPVPLDVALALMSAFLSVGHHSAAVVIGLCFHCLLRVEEVMSVTWSDLQLSAASVIQRYPQVCALVGIRKPKLRTGVGRNNRQFVTVEDSAFAGLLGWLTSTLGATEMQQLVWPVNGAIGFLKVWRRMLATLGLPAQFTPAGLRSGGATHHFLVHQDIPRLRRRGRWQQDKTLEHYLHEVIYAMEMAKLTSRQVSKVQHLARLTGAICLDLPSTPPPPLSSRIPSDGLSGWDSKWDPKF